MRRFGYGLDMADVAVIFPVHNESWLIGSVLGQVTDFARSHPDWTFIFVDDGSSDDTPDLIRSHLEGEGASDRIELMSLSPNRGKAGAIREAMLSRDESMRTLPADDGTDKIQQDVRCGASTFDGESAVITVSIFRCSRSLYLASE